MQNLQGVEILLNMKNLLKNLSYTFIANIISLVISLLVTLFLPKIIGENDFGYWQLYLFYISYAGILHIGICDGIYLRYGGQSYESLNKEKLKSQFISLVIFLFVISFFTIGFTWFFDASSDNTLIMIFVLVGSVIHVIKTFFLLILQTTSRLKDYSLITIIDRLVFVATLVIIILFYNNNYVYLIYTDILGKLVSLAFALYSCSDILFTRSTKVKESIKELILNLKAGFPLLVAGLASSFIIGCIRIGIEKGWDIATFGKISLSLSVTNMFLSFVTMVGIVFFPIIKTLEKEKYKSFFNIGNVLIILISLIVLIFAIPIQDVIKLWLPNYYYSMQTMVIIIPICIFECENSILLNTFLKSLRKEKSILIINLFMVIISMFYTYLFTSIFKSIDLLVFGIVLLIGIRTLITKIYVLHLLDMNVFKFEYYSEFLIVILYLFIIALFNNVFGILLNILIYIFFIILNRKRIKESLELIRRKI